VRALARICALKFPGVCGVDQIRPVGRLPNEMIGVHGLSDSLCEVDVTFDNERQQLDTPVVLMKEEQETSLFSWGENLARAKL
jgi:hypothetical protein